MPTGNHVISSAIWNKQARVNFSKTNEIVSTRLRIQNGGQIKRKARREAIWVKVRQVQNAGHRSQVTGQRPQVTGHRSQVTGRRSQVAGHRSHVPGLRSQKI